MSADQDEGPERPRIFLYLASVMVLLAVAAYVFQDALLDMGGSGTAFLFALVLPVLMALFFVYCYRVPRFGLKLLGRNIEPGGGSEKIGGLTYNLFRDESAADEKRAQTRRKSARHLRRQLARATAETKETTAETKERAPQTGKTPPISEDENST